MPTVIGGTMKEAISDACWYLRGWGSLMSERMDFANDLWFQVVFYEWNLVSARVTGTSPNGMRIECPVGGTDRMAEAIASGIVMLCLTTNRQVVINT
jgi:hypothetical protein